jgi:hypothetical protein
MAGDEDMTVLRRQRNVLVDEGPAQGTGVEKANAFGHKEAIAMD